MSTEFVSYDEALSLQEIGFNIECLAYVDDENDILFDESAVCIGAIPAPLWQQVFKFFRDRYNLFAEVEFDRLKVGEEDETIETYEYKINEKWSFGKSWYDYQYGFKHIDCKCGFRTYEEARLACIKQLIEIAKTPKE